MYGMMVVVTHDERVSLEWLERVVFLHSCSDAFRGAPQGAC